MFSNWRATSGSVLVPHVVPMVSGSKRGSHTVPSGLPSSYMDKALSVTPLLRSGEGIESSYCDIGGVLPVTTACPLDGVGGGATSDTVPMSTRQRVANITNEASNSTDDDASKSNGAAPSVEPEGTSVSSWGSNIDPGAGACRTQEQGKTPGADQARRLTSSTEADWGGRSLGGPGHSVALPAAGRGWALSGAQ